MASPRALLFALPLVLIVTSLFTACGYTATTRQDGRAASNTDSQELNFEMARNQITPPRPGLEYEFTRRLKEEIALDRRFELSTTTSLVLEITLVNFEEPATVRDFDNLQTETSLNAEALVRISHRNDKTRVKSVKAWTSYSTRNGETRSEGLDRLWRELAREVLDFADDYDWLKAAREGEAKSSDKEATDAGAKG